MRLGVVTPVLTLLPRAHARWEEDGTIDDVARIVAAADGLGYDHVTCSEHVAIPTTVAATRGGRYWDPLATFGYLAAVTEAIRLTTSVVVLGYHHPLAIAKRYGTLDQVSGGRLILGVGVGSLEAEFDLLGAEFADRGARADDSMRALRAAMSSPHPSYHGPYFQFEGVELDPAALQERVPMWVGGRTARSLQRAIELGDGWCPFGLSLDELDHMITAARSTEAWHARPDELDLVLQAPRAFDPLGDLEATIEGVVALRGAGATVVSLRLVHHSRAHYIEQLEAMIETTKATGPDARAP